MKIQALKSFTTADLKLSLGVGWVADVDTDLATELISDGLAEEYKQLVPTGNISITENGTVNVAQYENAVVNVGIYTVSYDANGGTGTITNATVIAGNSIVLDDGTGLTAPENKTFGGWATTSSAEESDVSSPYTPHANTTLYAVWIDTYTVTYSANGGTGTIDPVTVVAGSSITLSDGTGLTAPEDKTFGGWATTDSAEEPDVTSPYTPEASVTLYAVWVVGE